MVRRTESFSDRTQTLAPTLPPLEDLPGCFFFLPKISSWLFKSGDLAHIDKVSEMLYVNQSEIISTGIHTKEGGHE